MYFVEYNNISPKKSAFNRNSMKKISIVRHAKSSWEGNFMDIDRPLSKRGLSDLSLMTSELSSYGLTPDLVISSPANRALTTAKYFTVNLPIDSSKLEIIDNLYDFSGNLLVTTIRETDNVVNHLMAFGHNHALTYFVNTFGSKYIDNVPTCGFVTIEFPENDWSKIEKGITTQILFPRELRD